MHYFSAKLKNKQHCVALLASYIVFLLFCSYFFAFTEKGLGVFIVISPILLVFLPTLFCHAFHINNAEKSRNIKFILWLEPMFIAFIPSLLLFTARLLDGLDLPYIEIITFLFLCLALYAMLIITLIISACFLYLAKKVVT